MRLTKKQAYPIIEQYFRSGLMAREFYTQVGWTDNQFYLWRNHYMQEHNMFPEEESSAPSFHPIEVSQPEKISPTNPEESFTIEIIYPNGVTLRVYSKNTSQLVDLIKLY
ncbi:IS66 family insertion sequence element accessory protein TnpA [Dysgonomonas reticulitermitis]